MSSLVADRETFMEELRETYQQRYGRRLQVVTHRNTSERPFSRIDWYDATSEDGSLSIVVKTIVPHPENTPFVGTQSAAEVEFEALGRLSKLFDSTPELAVPEPIAYWPATNSVAMMQVPGHALEQELKRLRPWESVSQFRLLQQQIQLAGRWLGHFQSLESETLATTDDLNELINRCDHRLKLIESARDRQVPRALRDRVMGALREVRWSAVASVRKAACHGDFGIWNIMVDDERLTVIDFMAFRQDLALIDPLGMLIHLESLEHEPLFSRRRVRSIQQAFVEGLCYRPAEPYPVAVWLLCETYHRLCRVQDCVLAARQSVTDRMRNARTLSQNLNWLHDIRNPSFATVEDGMATLATSLSGP